MRRPGGKRRCGLADKQSGFSLVAAVFLIVVLAALGTFAVQIAMTQYQTANVELLEARAQAAAQAGIEYGAYLALQIPATCPATTPPMNLTQGALTGYVVTVTCRATSHQVGTPATTKWVYTLSATASYGTYGKPDYVVRSITRNVTDAPP